MAKRNTKKQLLPKEVVCLARDIRRKLNELSGDISTDKSLDHLPVDLTDVYVVCLNYQILIDSLLAIDSRSGTKEAVDIFSAIYENLFIHLPHHYKKLPKELETLSIRLEPDKRKREEAADARLRKALDNASRFLKTISTSKKSE
jgi:hypothetical protein